MEQYTNDQYDDDLTIGAEEYGDTFQTADIDLFEFADDDESPISRLRTLVLSIDWEITDEVLLQFNEEILDLKDVWAEDKVRMIYLQALEKISRYIYRDKSDAHPNAIKLLLSMYYNLEKIVLSEDLPEEEIKPLLLSDVKKFEKLKQLISKDTPAMAIREEEGTVEAAKTPAIPAVQGNADELKSLKAIVLGIDWEITEKDLLDLREEVTRLEREYSDSRPKLVFLQGIGTLGTYIRKKKSNAHADAFGLLHSFYEGLETIVRQPMSLEEEKGVLLPEVDKFNEFKKVIASALSSDSDAVEDEDEVYETSGDIAPAFADYDEDDVKGFQEDEEVATLGGVEASDVDSRLDSFFGDEEEEAAEEPPVSFASDEEKQEAEALSDSFFDSDDAGNEPAIEVDRETALQGVDVETDADDDSDEDALPQLNGEIAPALMDNMDKSLFSDDSLADLPPEEKLSDEVTGKLDSFFTDTDEEEAEPEAPAFAVPADVALQGVDVDSEDDEEDEDDVPIAAIAGLADEELAAPDVETEDDDEPFPESSVAALSDVEEEQDLDFDFPDESDEGSDEMLSADLFGELDESIEQGLDEGLSEPLDEDEIASAFDVDGAGEDEEDVQTEEIDSALLDTEVATDTEVEEAEVVERFDELFGDEEQVEEPDEEEVIFTLEEEPESDEESVDVSLEDGDLFADVAIELEEEDILETVEESAQEEIFADEVLEEEPAELEPTVESEADVLVADDEDNFVEEHAAAGVAAVGIGAAATAVVEALESDSTDDELSDSDELAEEEYSEVFHAIDEKPIEEGSPALEISGGEAAPAANLLDCVDSLGVEINDGVLAGLFDEVKTLREKWAEKPVAKTYLQLIDTVAKHVDSHRDNADEESHRLLGQLSEGLAEVADKEWADKDVQEKLLGDTSQVLSWQQAMFDARIAGVADQSSVSLDGFAEQEKREDDPLAQALEAELETAMESEDDGLEDMMGEIDTFVPEGDDTVDAELEEVLGREAGMSGTDSDLVPDSTVTEIVRQEIDSLRKTLQQEIAELRNAIKGDPEE